VLPIPAVRVGRAVQAAAVAAALTGGLTGCAAGGSTTSTTTKLVIVLLSDGGGVLHLITPFQGVLTPAADGSLPAEWPAP
jgi:hypothetical protein